MGVDVVGAILRVVFDHEDGGVIPIRAVGDGIDNPPKREIIIGDGCGRRRLPFCGAESVIIGKIEQDECGQLRSASLLSRADELGKVVEKFIGAELVGILNVEVGKVGINVAAQRSQSWSRAGE